MTVHTLTFRTPLTKINIYIYITWMFHKKTITASNKRGIFINVQLLAYIKNDTMHSQQNYKEPFLFITASSNLSTWLQHVLPNDLYNQHT
jgi:hypothetical protein